MADETIINGVAIEVDDQTSDNFYDSESEANKIADLNGKIEVLEQEKLELARQNDGSNQKIKKLTAEIAGVKKDDEKLKERLREMEIEIEESKSGTRAVEAIAARASDLETEVARLQHDLISSLSDADEANKEVRDLKKVLAEKVSGLQTLEKENQLAIDGLKKEMEEAVKSNEVLEKRIGGMVEKENELKAEARERMDVKEKEISGLKKRIDEFETMVAKMVLELEKEKKEKKEIEALKNAAEEKIKEMESNMVQLQEKVVEVETVMCGLKEKTIEAVNGIAINTGSDDDLKGFNLQWPIVAAAGTIVVAGAVCYLQYGRRK